MRVSVDRRSWLERRNPIVSGLLCMFVFRGLHVLACIGGDLLIFAFAWLVYSKLPLVCPFMFSKIAILLPDLPEVAAGIVIPLVGYALFAIAVPPVVLAGIVLPTVMAVIASRNAAVR